MEEDKKLETGERGAAISGTPGSSSSLSVSSYAENGHQGVGYGIFALQSHRRRESLLSLWSHYARKV